MADTVSSYDVARRFIKAAGGDPNNNGLVRAVAIWLRFEIGGSITGNNPWNLHSGTACTPSWPGYVNGYCPGNGSLPGQIGNRYAGSGDKNVAVFRTLDDGIKANANNLIRLAPAYGYGKVLDAIRRGSAIDFLYAMQNSNWSAGHYGYTKLVSAFKSTSSFNWSITLRPAGGSSTDPGPSGGGNTKWLDAWGGIVSFPVGHVITVEDVETMMAKLSDAGWFRDYALEFAPGEGAARDFTRSILMTAVGKEWNKDLQDDLQGRFLGAAAAQDNPVASFLGQLGTVLGTLVENVGLIIVFGAGVALAFYGFSLLMSVSGPATFEVPDELHNPIGARR